jgi:hypothetical protein
MGTIANSGRKWCFQGMSFARCRWGSRLGLLPVKFCCRRFPELRWSFLPCGTACKFVPPQSSRLRAGKIFGQAKVALKRSGETLTI